MGLFSGLEKFGLGNLAGKDLYEDEKKKENEVKAQAKKEITEADLIFDKTYKCPVCDKEFSVKAVRAGKAKLINTDLDLRPKYEHIDTNKYDAVVCPNCGYAALARYFEKIMAAQRKLVRENISNSFRGLQMSGKEYSYDEAIERYKLVLANTMVKKAKMSEKAYVCLRTAWVIRGKSEALPKDAKDYEKQIEELHNEEKELLQNAKEGFLAARTKEPFPMCGMDELTLDYLLSVLAYELEDYDTASKLLAGVLSDKGSNKRMKEKSLELKQLIADKKAGK